MTTFSRRYKGPTPNNENIEMAISGEWQVALKKAQKDILDDWDAYADSPANSREEWRQEEPFSWRGLFLGFAMVASLGFMGWVCWQFSHLIRILVGW